MQKPESVPAFNRNFSSSQSSKQPSQFDVKPSSKDILIHNIKITPPLQLKKMPSHPAIIDYLIYNGIHGLTEFQRFCWSTVYRGRHLFAMPDSHESMNEDLKDTDLVLSYLCPIMSLMLEQLEIEENQNHTSMQETGYIKHSISQALNGPIFLIVCSSCRSAQKIFDIVLKILDMVSRHESCQEGPRRHNKQLKAMLIQGGGHESQYDVPLTNGCDILITATPFCLLRMIGNSRTNLERLKYLVFDEANVLMEKFLRPIRTLLANYSNLLKINEKQCIAQFIVTSCLWSIKLRKFFNDYLMQPVFISVNKLESSFFGQTHHVVDVCNGRLEKVNYFLNKINDLSHNTQVKTNKNIIIFVNRTETAIEMRQLLLKNCFSNVDIITKMTRLDEIAEIEKIWDHYDDQAIANKRFNNNLILIIEQGSIDDVNISNAKYIINYDFPSTKSAYGERLWFMRRYFPVNKEYKLEEDKDNSNKEQIDLNSAIMERLGASGDLSESNGSASERIRSFLIVTKFDTEYSEGLYNFLIRTGYDEKNFPDIFIDMVKKRKASKDLARFTRPLCPHLKTFGKCMNMDPSSCPYRHKPYLKSDDVQYLDENLKIPSEGYVKFKITYIEEANKCHVNIIGHEDLKREKSFEFNKLTDLDAEIQLYFSDPDNIKYPSRLNPDDFYAFKDITTSLFKRVSVVHVPKKSDKIAPNRITVKCIDYGPRFNCSVFDLIKLPSKFKTLPPQAIEVYFCNIRPVECDLYWSIAARRFISEKLSKTREYVGKIQLAAGNTLWLNPISSYKNLTAINLVIIDDFAQLELIQNKYGVHYPSHMRDLRELFEKNNIPIPRLEDESILLEKESSKFMEKYYDFEFDSSTVFYAHLDRSNKHNEIFVSSVYSPSKFFIQNVYSIDLLEKLNSDIKDFIRDVESLKNQICLTKSILNLDTTFLDSDIIKERASDIDFLKRTEFIRNSLNKKLFDWLKSKNRALYCLAKLNQDGGYYRAKIIDFISDETKMIKVFFVDYGDDDKINLNEIYPISEKFIRISQFQAIECSLDGILPFDLNNNEQNEWSEQSGDNLWDLTHTENNNHCYLYANVISSDIVNEETYSDCVRNEIKDSKYSKNKQIRNKYSITMHKKSYPEYLNLAHKLVAQKCAKFTDEEEKNVFSCLSDRNISSSNETINKKIFSNLAKKFITNFIKNPDIKNQSEFISVLESRSVFFQRMSIEEAIDTNLIQTISAGLFFINNTTHIGSLIKFLRRSFFLRKKEDFIKVFCENKGLRNLLILLAENSSDETVEAILSLLTELLDSDTYKMFVIDNEKYLRRFWEILEYLKPYEARFEKLIFVIESISDFIVEKNIQLEERIIKSIEYITKDILECIKDSKLRDRTSNLFEKISLQKKESSKPASLKNGDDTENTDEDEDKAKSRRVLDFIIASGKNVETKFQPKQDYGCESPPGTSDEEILDNYEADLMNLLSCLGNNTNGNRQAQPRVDEWLERKDYRYPLISWNQTKETIILTVKLAKVKEMEINYGPKNFIYFRTTVNKVKYGFDLNLFADIDESKCSAEAKEKFIEIVLKKKVEGIWQRLLSSVNKPKFIKCEYNNLDSESDNEKKEKSEFSNFLKEAREKNPAHKHFANINLDLTSSSKSDSSSDFDDNQCDDLKERRDVYWD